MRSRESTNLPLASNEYNPADEQLMRRTVENAISDLRVDILETRATSDKTASLGLRRHQFLLMGASNG